VSGRDPDPRFARLQGGRHGLRPEEVAEHQRWRLLAAAGDTLLAHGYQETTSRLIVRRANISMSAFYRHFDNADECLIAAHAIALDSLSDLLRSACAGDGRWPDRLARACREAAAFLASEPGQARLLGTDLAVGIPAAALARERFLERLAGLLGAGREMPLAPARELPSGTETHLVAATFFLLGDWVSAGERDPLPARAPELTAILRLPDAGPL
jgi:AcrR family transcriptional regulator